MTDTLFKLFFEKQEEKGCLVHGFGHLSSQEEKDSFKETILLARKMFDMPIDEVEVIDDIITRLKIFRRLLERCNFLEAILVSKVIYDNIGNRSITKTTVLTIFDQQKNAMHDIFDNRDELSRLEPIVFSHYRQMILMINDMIAKELLVKDYTESRTMLYAIGTGVLPFQVRFDSCETICMKVRGTFDSVLLSIKYLLLWRMYFIHEKMLDEDSKVDLSLVLSKEQLTVLWININQFNDWCLAPTFLEITEGLPSGMLNADPFCRNPLTSKNPLPFHVMISDDTPYMVFDQPVMAQDEQDNLSFLVIFCLTFLKSLMLIRFSLLPKTEILSYLIPPCILNIFKAYINANGVNVGGTGNRVYIYLNTHSRTESYALKKKEVLLRLVQNDIFPLIT